jgi:hypothetical protein
MSPRPWKPLVVALLVSASTLAAADSKPAVNKGPGDLAIRGYDPVAYVVAGTATKGTSKFEYRWKDAVWRFASAANRARFIKDPERYAPQFGGYCAWAISRGYMADADPETWRVVDGRLYLIYSKAVERRWEQDIEGNIAKARANWPAVLDK